VESFSVALMRKLSKPIQGKGFVAISVPPPGLSQNGPISGKLLLFFSIALVFPEVCPQ
jgi:hypothetical protein